MAEGKGVVVIQDEVIIFLAFAQNMPDFVRIPVYMFNS